MATEESTDARYCRVVDAHYFRGRYNVASVIERNNLENERRFDDVLMRAGIVTHYLPRSHRDEEKGIDVWFALEAFELAVYKRFNVLVLVACDSDYVPLIRKLNTLGTRVMLLGWDFKYIDERGQERETRTSQALIDEVTYYVPMHTEIDNNVRRRDPVIDALFYQPMTRKEVMSELRTVAETPRRKGTVKAVKEGFGFIIDPEETADRFFFHSSVEDELFNALQPGDAVEFEPSRNEKGLTAVNIRVLAPGE